jgi:lipoprotein-anchoring transpeptidase ErfK/SrfK
LRDGGGTPLAAAAAGHNVGGVTTRLSRAASVAVVAVITLGTAGCGSESRGALAARSVPSAPASAPATRALPPPPPLKAVPPPAHLAKISYWRTPGGFPADPDPASTTAVTEGLRPDRKLAVYDAPGGTPRAFLPPSISGLPVVVPIVGRRPGWVGVLLPTANRRIGWLPDAGWTARHLPDQLIVDLGSHELTWLHDGRRRAGWKVATGAADTPTPVGRTFVLGRTPTGSPIYTGQDALVLGAIPEDRNALAASLRDGHTAIHGWYRPSAFGHSVSNGCVRVPKSAQRTLLAAIPAGTVVHVRAGQARR